MCGPVRLSTTGRSAGRCGVLAGRPQHRNRAQARRFPCIASAASSGEGSAGNRHGWKLGLWTALDVTATLGSVGAAVAFVLTQELLLVGFPVVLPLVALYASRQRESALVEVCFCTLLPPFCPNAPAGLQALSGLQHCSLSGLAMCCLAWAACAS